jgi:hypothetical protein
LFKFTLGDTPIHLPRCLSGEGWSGPASPTRLTASSPWFILSHECEDNSVNEAALAVLRGECAVSGFM